MPRAPWSSLMSLTFFCAGSDLIICCNYLIQIRKNIYSNAITILFIPCVCGGVPSYGIYYVENIRIRLNHTMYILHCYLGATVYQNKLYLNHRF